MIQEQAAALGLAMFSLLVRRCTCLLKESAKGKQEPPAWWAFQLPDLVRPHSALLLSRCLLPVVSILPFTYMPLFLLPA